MRVAKPLSPLTFLWRNAGKTLPLIAVIVLAVLLLAGIISLINSIPLSIRTIYAYSSQMLGLGPRGDATHTPEMVAKVQNECPIPVERVLTCRAIPSQVRSVVGKWPFAVIGLEQDDFEYCLKKLGARKITGRLPKPWAAEAIIAESVARNLNLKIGSELLGPGQNESFSPYSVKVVGIVESDFWFMLTNIEYLKTYHFPPVDLALVFAATQKEQTELDKWATEAFKGDRGQIFAYHQVEKQTNEMFVTLYKILNIVIATLVLVITVMMGMLINIYQSQRIVEFGLLQALGYTKKELLRRVLRETILVVVLGWVLGVTIAYGALMFAKARLMDPNAFALDPLDPRAYQYTFAVPAAILVTAIVTLIARFRSYDPVGVVERRIV